MSYKLVVSCGVIPEKTHKIRGKNEMKGNKGGREGNKGEKWRFFGILGDLEFQPKPPI